MPQQVVTWLFVLAVCGLAYYVGYVLPRRRIRRLAERLASDIEPHQLSTEEAFQVEMEGQIVVLRRPDGETESFSWAEIDRIDILTIAEGPFAPDVFWVFHSHGNVIAEIPSEASGTKALLDSASALPEFDTAAFTSAMGSTDDAVFNVWQRPSEPTTPQD